MDFFTVPTVTGRVLFVLVLLAHQRRRVVHVAITQHPTAAWTAHLRRVLAAYLSYYHGARTHLSLQKDAPTPRRIHRPTEGHVVAFSEVGGLHHRYERRAA